MEHRGLYSKVYACCVTSYDDLYGKICTMTQKAVVSLLWDAMYRTAHGMQSGHGMIDLAVAQLLTMRRA